MQTTANFVQDHVLGGPLPTAATPEYKHRGDGSQMKALAWFGTDDVQVVDAPVPDITEDDDIILKVTGSTICGSDLHLYHSEIAGLQKGDILGHEFMGVIDKIGPNIKNRKVGDRVVVSFQIACGTCEFCQKKLSSFCDRTNNSSLQNYLYGQRDAGFFGYSHFTGGFPGGQAEYVKVPFGDVNTLIIPDSVSDEKALYLSDVLPTSYNAVYDTEVNEGDIVGIWGAGPIGQSAAKWALLFGAKKVVMIDLIQERLDFAVAESGADRVEYVNASNGVNVPEEILKRYPKGLDVALDCGTFHEPKTLLHKGMKALMLETDVCETINEMIVSVRKQGRCGLTSAYSAFTNGFNVGALMERGIRLQGNGQAPVHKFWETILNDYIMTGKFDPTFMISHRVRLEEFKELYNAFDHRLGGIQKVFVETRFSNPPSEGCPKTTSAKDIV